MLNSVGIAIDLIAGIAVTISGFAAHSVGIRAIWLWRIRRSRPAAIKATKQVMQTRQPDRQGGLPIERYRAQTYGPVIEELCFRWGAFVVGSYLRAMPMVWTAVQVIWIATRSDWKDCRPTDTKAITVPFTTIDHIVSAIVYSALWWLMWWGLRDGHRILLLSPPVGATLMTLSVHLCWNGVAISRRPWACRWRNWINPLESEIEETFPDIHQNLPPRGPRPLGRGD